MRTFEGNNPMWTERFLIHTVSDAKRGAVSARRLLAGASEEQLQAYRRLMLLMLGGGKCYINF